MHRMNFKHGIVSLLLLALLLPEIPWVAAHSVTDQEQYCYARFSPSAIIVIVLVTALFLMGFFSIYIRHCTNGQTANSIRARVLSRRATGATRGLDSSVIETFPTLVYSVVKSLKIGKGALEWKCGKRFWFLNQTMRFTSTSAAVCKPLA